MRKNILIKLLVLLAGCGALWFFYAAGIGCLFRYFFHVDCPGCGMTHAMLACLRFDFAAAFQYHPMVFSMPLLFLFFLTDGELFKDKRVNTALIFLIALGFAVHYVIRLFVNY